MNNNNTENYAVHGLPADTYHADKTRVSKHGLDLIHRAPALYRHRQLAPPELRTPAMRWGTLVHLWVLEPEHVAKETFEAPTVDRRTKAGKEAWDAALVEAGTRELVTAEERAQLDQITEAVHMHPLAGHILGNAYPQNCEISLYWKDLDTRATCRARPDLHVDNYVVDLKTTTNASADAFARDAWKFRYHVQAAFYIDAFAAVGKRADTFVFIAVEKDAPHLVQVFVPEDEWIDAGRATYKRDLEIYMRCLESDKWPGLSDDAQPLTVPAWAK